MSINNSSRATWPSQLKATMTGSIIKIGSLEENPVIMYMNNLGTVEVDVYVNDPIGANDPWMTFAAGQAIAVDMRTQAHLASNFSADLGTTFYGNGASGDFSISYIAARDH